MKLYSLLKIDLRTDVVIEAYWALDSFPFFARKTVREIITLGAREICSRSIRAESNKNNLLVSVGYKDTYMIHAWLCPRKKQNEAWVATTDKEYPSRVILHMLDRAQASTVPANTEQLLLAYQTPSSVDKIEKVKCELDETKHIVLDTIEKLLERGETLDSLLEKTNALSTESKVFASRAKDMNRCCNIL
jgi:synaptobrevin homolog YKT6